MITPWNVGTKPRRRSRKSVKLIRLMHIPGIRDPREVIVVDIFDYIVLTLTAVVIICTIIYVKYEDCGGQEKEDHKKRKEKYKTYGKE